MAYFARPQSTAVKIVKPPSNEYDPSRSPQPTGTTQTRKDSVQRQCRNIVIYGHCKFQDKGCIYYHPPTTTDSPPPGSGGPRAESPATPALSAQAVNAPVFVPKSASAVTSSGAGSGSRQASIAELSPSASPAPQAQEYSSYDNEQGTYNDYTYQEEGDAGMEGLTHQMEELDPQYYDDHYAGLHYPSEYDDGATAAYYATAAPPIFLRQPLNYHLYTPLTYPDFVPSTVNTHFVPPSAELRKIIQERSEVTRGIALPGLNLPEELQGYHTLVPLEPIGTGIERRKFGNWYSTVYRAIKSSDGLPYVLRRVENYRLTQQSAFAPIEFWSNLKHPGIINIKEAFTTRAFDDNSLVVVYAYYPNAETLFDAHLKQNKPPPPTSSSPFKGGYQSPFSQQQQRSGRPQFTYSPSTSSPFNPQSASQFGAHQQQQALSSPFSSATGGGLTQFIAQPIPERTVWSYIVQIASAIKKVHDADQAVRVVDVSKVLVTSQNRIRISACGTIDVLLHDTPQDVHQLQQEDLTMFGRLIFAVCCGNPAASSGAHFQKSVDVIVRVYGQDMKNLALWLISKGTMKSIDHVLDMIRHRVMQEQEEALNGVDRLEHELQSELENARLVRLMVKFGFINERPEFAREPRWSETGDRYIIKLFRDYVFHQVDEHGNPVLNMSHVLTCLNKLDAGTDEKIMLIARDEQSCLVVSYKEIKSCIEGAFGDLAKAAIASPAAYKQR